jgi:hypothetical protein
VQRSELAALLAALVLLAAAAKATTPKPEAPEKVTVNQLEQALSAAHGKSDAEVAQTLSSLELAERLSTVRLDHLKADLPGGKSQQALAILADQSAFLPPPESDTVTDPIPDPAATRQMLVQIVNYVNATLRQLPNLIAIRETTGFEDRPAEDSLESTGVVSLSYLSLHEVGKSSIAITFRDRREVEDESASNAFKHEGKIGGLITSGEFGPILSTVLADAIKGKITWARWERGPSGRLAVLHFAVPDGQSNYRVKFCCIPNGLTSTGQPDMQVFDERSSYHGDITFDPANGSILRIALQAEMPPKGLVPNAGIVVEYGPVEIGGKTYLCPVKSVSVLQAHTALQQGAISRTNYQGAAKTFLNEVEFDQYRRFGSETRIVSGDNDQPAK